MKLFAKVYDFICLLFWMAIILVPFFMYIWGYGI